MNSFCFDVARLKMVALRLDPLSDLAHNGLRFFCLGVLPGHTAMEHKGTGIPSTERQSSFAHPPRMTCSTVPARCALKVSDTRM